MVTLPLQLTYNQSEAKTPSAILFEITMDGYKIDSKVSSFLFKTSKKNKHINYYSSNFTMWWVLAFIVAVVWGYWFLIRPHKFWTRKGVPQGTPRFILGDTWGTLGKQSPAEMIEMVYKMCPNTRWVKKIVYHVLTNLSTFQVLRLLPIFTANPCAQRPRPHQTNHRQRLRPF